MKYLLFLCFLSFPSFARNAENLTVLHWWTAGSEALALKVIQNELKKNNIQFNEEAHSVDMAMTILKTSLLNNLAPNITQLKGPQVIEFAKENVLVPLNSALDKQFMNSVPPALRNLVNYRGELYALPTNIHRANWMWVNQKILKELKISPPRTWADFLSLAPVLKNKGYIPLALSGQKWQLSILFENIVLSLGEDFYQKSLIDLDAQSLSSKQMLNALSIFRQLKKFTDSQMTYRSWDQTTRLVIEDKAFMQIMGDWAQSEFILSKKNFQSDFLCIPAPGTKDNFLFLFDSFAFIKSSPLKAQSNPSLSSAQSKFIEIVLRPEIQQQFNLLKGAIPVDPNISLSEYPTCSQKANLALKKSLANQSKLIPSVASDMVHGPFVVGRINDILAHFFFSDEDPQITMNKMKQLRMELM